MTPEFEIADHFNAVAEAILSAKSEIYIADWWLTPELVRVHCLTADPIN